MFARMRNSYKFRSVPVILLASMLMLITLQGIATGQPPGMREGRSVPVTILSIIPSQAEPGMSVTLYGSGFSDETRVLLGPLEAQTTVQGPKQLSFEIPDMAPGLYGLFVRREDGVISKGYRFSVTSRTPFVTSLTPDKIFACTSNDEREVQISGRKFSKEFPSAL